MHLRVEFVTEERVSYLSSREDSGTLLQAPFTQFEEEDPSVVVVINGLSLESLSW